MVAPETPARDRTADKPPHPRRWIPLSLRMFLATLALLAISTAVWIGVWIYPRWAAIRRIEQVGGRVESTQEGPNWLRRWIDRGTMMAFEDVLEIHVNTSSDETDNVLPYVGRFPKLRCLDLGGAAASDAGLGHIHGLPSIKEMHLG